MASSNDLTIKDIRTHLMAIPFVEPPKVGFQIRNERHFLFVEVETAGGIVGMGYLNPLGGGLRTLDTLIHELLKPILLGRDASHVEGLWRDMYRATYIQGRMGLPVMALSALDIALWDILGKRAGLPLYRLWGAVSDDLPIYGSGCFRGEGQDGMIAKAHRYVKQGFSAIKMQVAHVHTLNQDLDNVRAMREALGEDVEIMIDVNQGWTADQAIQMGRKFADHNVYWLEEPVEANDFEGYRRIARAVPIRIAGGENHFTRFDFRPFFEDPCIPVLQPDVMRGGLTELRKIAAIADTWGLLIAPHLFHELMAHVVGSIPNGMWLEYMGWHDDLWVEPVQPEKGRVRVPERPGHGLAVKPELLRDHPYRD